MRIASPRTARLINDRTAFDLLLRYGPLSRTGLQRRSGLSRATVGDLVDRLVEAGLIAQVGASEERRRGPNALLYDVVADRAHVAGMEVRTTEALASVNDFRGRQVGTARLPVDPDAEPDRVVYDTLVVALADAGLGAGDLRGLVVGTPGLVDPDTGDVSYIGLLPSWHHNLLPGLRERLGDLPVLVENEVNLVALAEQRLGAARGHDTFALLSFGEGVGMAVMLGGRLHRGRSGGAGEIAWLPAGLGGMDYSELIEGWALAALAEQDGLTAHDPLELVRQASPELLDMLADRVAFGVIGVCSVLDPGFVVLGGPMGRAGGAVLAERVAERIKETIPLTTEVVPAQLDGDPVVRGAVCIALERLYEQTFA
ncbi:ROK family transcriptional regulator [Planotetraspora sp. GP83]|uniref:ROK family transcriptional regulator n=1 Tax=Planotetraspora sp. GP83 TaxID=3156264 RepID=UPI003516A6C9